MEKPDTREILWANILTLMEGAYGREHLSNFATDTGIGNATMTRIKERESFVRTETLEKIAGKFGLEPWQLLVPEMGRKPTVSQVDHPRDGSQNDLPSSVDGKEVKVRTQQEILWNLWSQLREEDREEWLASARRAIRARHDSELDNSIAALTAKPRAAKKA